MTLSDTAPREFLRHTIATFAYRGGKVLRDVPDRFPAFRASPGSRTPAEILVHICDLLDWMIHLCEGQHIWEESRPQAWEDDRRRFFEGLRRIDEQLASPEALGFQAEKLFQGPVADALTHVGQIAMLRRIAGAPVRGENYFKADIRAGRTGAEQSEPRVEFD